MICWIIPIIVGLLSFLLGYLMANALSKPKKVETDVEWKSKYQSAKLSLDKCLREKNQLNKELSICEIEINKYKSKLSHENSVSTNIEPELSFDSILAKRIFGKNVFANDLTVIDGIGPKIAELFKANGVKSWWKLSTLSIEACKRILDKGGDHYKSYNPKTWPKQADLAYKGKWKELFEMQKKID